MNKVAVLVVAVLCLVTCGSSISSAQTLSYNLDSPSYQISKDSDGFDRIEMTGFRSNTLPGNPVLPSQTVNLLVHPDVIYPTIKVTVVAEDFETLDGTYSIRPAGPHTARVDDQYVYSWSRAANIAEGKNMDVYGQDAFFPSESVRAEPHSQLRQWKFIRVVFRPFQYNPVSGELRWTKRVQFNITYDRSSDQAGPVKAADSAGTVARGVAPSIFYNYSELKDAYTSGKMADQTSGTTYDYVIITTNEIVAETPKLADFIAHKEDQGHSVLLVTEDDFDGLTGQAPNNRAEKIRQWLIDNYVGYGIEYVLLIGNPSPFESGEGDIPMKMCWPRFGKGTYEEAPTDMFYADLTGNWDRDGDGYFGEWSDFTGTGGVDLTAEVAVGRIPVYDPTNTYLQYILTKIIKYENEVNPTWRNSILLPMSFLKRGYDSAQLAEQMKDDYLTARGWSTWTQYQQGSMCPEEDSIYESDEELVGGTVVRDRWAANHFGIVCWSGHGTSWSAIVGSNDCIGGLLFQCLHVVELGNSYPSFTFQISCMNGYPEDSANLGYMLLRVGAICTVSATRASWFNSGVLYGEFDDWATNLGMAYQYVNGVTQQIEAGKALNQTRLALLPIVDEELLMNLYVHNLYGDPSTNISGITNTPPVADNQTVAVSTGTPTAITLTASDAEMHSLTFYTMVSPKHGTLTGSAPNVTYTPNAGYAGPDSFTFRVRDKYSYSNTATVSLIVGGYVLNIVKDGAGSGSVTSAPGGIDCGAGCSGNYNRGAVVTLTATPDAGSALKSWNDASCPGNGDCVVTMDADKTITATFEPDLDDDGISTAVENAGPNGGDGNRDGTPDAQQSLVSTFQDTNGNYVTLVADGGATLARVEADRNPSAGDAPAGTSFPCGFLEFRLLGVAPGGSAMVTVILHQKTDINSYYKYGPEPGTPTPHWYKFMYAQSTGAQIYQEATQTRIVLNFVDGGRGDDDLTANGVIDDIGAPSLGTTAASSGGGGGGGGGCFIESLLN